MNTRNPLLTSIVLIAVMAAFSAWAWNAIPAGTPIAVHWDVHNHADGFAPKVIALTFAPALALLLTALFAAWPGIEPRRANLVSSRIPYIVGWIGTVAILAGVHIVVVMAALGVALDIGGYAIAGVSLLLIVLGNFLGKSRANFFLGVRTPWSLSSDLSWEKSSRLSGRLFVLTGVVTLGALVAAGQTGALYTSIGGTLVTAICGVAASYIYWKRDPDSHAGDDVLE